MMNIKNIHAGASAEVFIYNRAGIRKSFKTKFDQLTGKNIVSVLANNVAPSFLSSDEYELFIRVGDDDYLWEGENSGTGKTFDGYDLLKIKLHSPIAEKSSRRAHFRITHLVHGELLYLDKNDKSASCPVELTNVSAGGAAFLAELPMEPGQVNKLRFPLSTEQFTLNFSVISQDEMPSDFHIPFRYHCRWESLPAKIEENLVRLIFRQQQGRR